jgi:hypothetical protein
MNILVSKIKLINSAVLLLALFILSVYQGNASSRSFNNAFSPQLVAASKAGVRPIERYSR